MRRFAALVAIAGGLMACGPAEPGAPMPGYGWHCTIDGAIPTGDACVQVDNSGACCPIGADIDRGDGGPK